MRKSCAASFFCLFCLFSGVTEVFAYRPLVTEDAGVAGKAVGQLETSWDYLRWGPGDSEASLLLVPIYGVTERLEMSVEIPYLFHDPPPDDEAAEGTDSDREGLGDINLVGKFALSGESESAPALALKGAVKTSSGDVDQGLGSGDEDWSVVGVASKTLKGVTWHGMLGYTFVGENGDDNIRDIYLYGLAADFALNSRWHFLSELTGNRHPDRQTDRHPVSVFAGATYALSAKVTLDGGLRLGLNSAVPDWSATFGATTTF